MIQVLNHFLSFSRIQKRLFSILLDVVVLFLASVLAVWIRLGEFAWPLDEYLPAGILLLFIAIPIFYSQGLYRAIIRYIGQKFLSRVFIAVSAVFVVWTAALFMFQLAFPRSAIIITWLLVLLFIIGSRVVARRLFYQALQQSVVKKNRRKVLIYGVGRTGRQVFDALLQVPDVLVVGFIDDDKNLANQEVLGVRVYAPETLSELIDRFHPSDLYLAKSFTPEQQKKLQWLKEFPIVVKQVPNMHRLLSGEVDFSRPADISVDQLLGRDTVHAHQALLSECITHRTILVTGAGGSIGSELCRQIIALKPKQLILYELSELALYQIDQELRESIDNAELQLIALLGSVLDEAKLTQVFQRYAVDTVYHAAAYKHVPIVEHNLEVGLRNNAFGTWVLAKLSARFRVKNFVLLSTDKAVRPTNVMGASKRLSEMVLQALQLEFPKTAFVMVRFGNVLGSSGSVIPLFREQIKKGGPVTVTHPEMTRYFMTIPEAVSLVIQAGSLGKGGEVFVLKMGQPVNIDMLAQKMIQLSGFEVRNSEHKDGIEIVYTGLRPGEKLYEELLIDGNAKETLHPKILMANEAFLTLEELEAAFSGLDLALQRMDYDSVFQQLECLVSGFQPDKNKVDYFW